MKPVQLPLPEERLAPAARGAVAATWALVAVLVALANVGAVALLGAWTPNRGQELIRTKWEVLDGLPAGVGDRSLILGDSTGNQGVDPALMREALGGEWVNLCTVGQMLTAGDAWMLGRYVEEHGPPTRVVMVRIADVWPLKPDPQLIAAVPRPIGWWRHEQPAVDLGLRREVDVLLARYAPLYVSNQSLAFVIKTPWRLGEVYREVRADGFMPMRGQRPEEFEPDLAEWLRFLDQKEFRVSRINREALERVADLGERHGFDVYFAHGPAWDRLAADPRYRAWFAEAHAMLQAFAAEHPRFRLVFDAPQPFPYEQLQDVEHLTVEGAAVYSRRVAEAIAAIEAAP